MLRPPAARRSEPEPEGASRITELPPGGRQESLAQAWSANDVAVRSVYPVLSGHLQESPGVSGAPGLFVAPLTEDSLAQAWAAYV